jgi:chemotaxis response regulator CheB
MERKKRVLVVEDDARSRKLFSIALEAVYDIVEAASGAEAIQRAHSNDPLDLIIIDLELPDTIGDEYVSRNTSGRAPLPRRFGLDLVGPSFFAIAFREHAALEKKRFAAYFFHVALALSEVTLHLLFGGIWPRPRARTTEQEQTKKDERQLHRGKTITSIRPALSPFVTVTNSGGPRSLERSWA